MHTPVSSEMTALADPRAQSNVAGAPAQSAGLVRLTCSAVDRSTTPAGQLDVVLSAGSIDALAAQAQRLACPIDALAYAAFATLLARYTGESDVWVSSAAGGALRIDLGGDPLLRTALLRARAVLAADADAGAGAGAGVAEVHPANAFNPSSAAVLTGGARERGPAGIDPELRPAADTDLGLAFIARADGVYGRWSFDGQRFDAPSIARLAGHYARVLAAFSADLDRPVSAIALLTGEEREARIRDATGNRPLYEREATIPALWLQQVLSRPTAVALIDGQHTLSYADVDRRANALAWHLRSLGVVAGSAVGVAFDRSIHLPIALLAILKAGGAYVPLDPAYPPERLAFMIADAEIGVIVSRHALPVAVAFLGRLVLLDSDAPALDETAREAPECGGDTGARAYITYTSGSTGRPKGVAVSHRGVVRLVRSPDYVAITVSDGYLQHAPLAFDASTFEIWAPLLNGARLGIPRPGLLSMTDLAAAIERFEVTTLFLTTSLFERLVDSGFATLGPLRQVLTGGEVASPAHLCRFIDRYPACRLSAVYGPTENTTFSTALVLATQTAVGTSVPIGRPIANSTAYVVDPSGQLAPIGVPGELWVGGDGVATGYLGLAELSAERFIADPFSADPAARVYKTGDRAYWRTDGVLMFLGRFDDQVKIRGYRIELGEIEAILSRQSGVAAAAVVVATTGGAKVLYAYVVPATGVTLHESELRAHLTTRLPHYMLPNRIAVVAALPEHASGKTDRVTLARWAEHPPATQAATGPHRATPAQPALPVLAPRPTLGPLSPQRRYQQTIGDIWREVLQLEQRPPLDQNFFDAGGDSLRLLTVHSRLQAQLGTPIHILDLFEYPSIGRLAAHLAATVSA